MTPPYLVMWSVRSANQIDQQDWDAADAQHLKGKMITTCGMQSLARICKNMKPPVHPDHIASYRQWLLYDSSESQNLSPELLHIEIHSTLDAGPKLPYPFGHNWRAALEALDPDEESTSRALRACLRDSYRELKDLKRYPEFYGGYRSPTCTNIHATPTHKGAKPTIRAMEALVKNTIETLPKTLAQAWVGEDADAWREAAELEFNTLTNMGVRDHNHSAEDLVNAGVETSPIPMRVVLDNKDDGEGAFLKHKVQIKVSGHNYNMQKGLHYDDVHMHAPAPNQHTSRLLSALHIQMHLKCKPFDINLAYRWADLPSRKRIAVKCPKGYERKGPDGKGLYMVMQTHCYCHPAASKAWSEHCDEFVMKELNPSGPLRPGV